MRDNSTYSLVVLDHLPSLNWLTILLSLAPPEDEWIVR